MFSDCVNSFDLFKLCLVVTVGGEVVEVVVFVVGALVGLSVVVSAMFKYLDYWLYSFDR